MPPFRRRLFDGAGKNIFGTSKGIATSTVYPCASVTGELDVFCWRTWYNQLLE